MQLMYNISYWSCLDRRNWHRMQTSSSYEIGELWNKCQGSKMERQGIESVSVNNQTRWGIRRKILIVKEITRSSGPFSASDIRWAQKIGLVAVVPRSTI